MPFSLANASNTFMRLMNHVLISLIDKCVILEQSQEITFQALKDRLTHAPILALTNIAKSFSWNVMLLIWVVGFVLLQEGHLIVYFSEKFKCVHRTYSTYDKKLNALVKSLHVWQHYLFPKEFVIHSDYKPLKHLMGQIKLNKSHIK
ncbi:Retrovirus-related Pol polyprotein from transposon 17.6, partial [Mucuna pruriens]